MWPNFHHQEGLADVREHRPRAAQFLCPRGRYVHTTVSVSHLSA